MKADELFGARSGKTQKKAAKLKEFQAPVVGDTTLHTVQARLAAGSPAVGPVAPAVPAALPTAVSKPLPKQMAPSAASIPASLPPTDPMRSADEMSDPAGTVTGLNGALPFGIDSEDNLELMRIRNGSNPALLNAIINWN